MNRILEYKYIIKQNSCGINLGDVTEKKTCGKLCMLVVLKIASRVGAEQSSRW